MPQHTHAPGHICAHCDGFPVVAITTGTRRLDGTLSTITVNCPACNGTGHAPASRALVAAGR
jgi:DnaJ-class molecular chaperone